MNTERTSSERALTIREGTDLWHCTMADGHQFCATSLRKARHIARRALALTDIEMLDEDLVLLNETSQVLRSIDEGTLSVISTLPFCLDDLVELTGHDAREIERQISVAAPTSRSGPTVKVLDEAECRRRLAAATVGRLAVVTPSGPDVFPVNFVVANNVLLIKTESGTKLAAALANTPVAFEVDDVANEERSGWSVVVRGPAKEVQDIADVLAFAELDLEPWIGERHRWLRIEIDEITGRELDGQ